MNLANADVCFAFQCEHPSFNSRGASPSSSVEGKDLLCVLPKADLSLIHRWSCDRHTLVEVPVRRDGLSNEPEDQVHV